jgi:hypothetical protein
LGQATVAGLPPSKPQKPAAAGAALPCVPIGGLSTCSTAGASQSNTPLQRALVHWTQVCRTEHRPCAHVSDLLPSYPSLLAMYDRWYSSSKLTALEVASQVGALHTFLKANEQALGRSMGCRPGGVTSMH